MVHKRNYIIFIQYFFIAEHFYNYVVHKRNIYPLFLYRRTLLHGTQT